MAAKTGIAILFIEKTKALGWVIVAIFSPFILLNVVLCSLSTGNSDHNNAILQACFYYRTSLPSSLPDEYQTHIRNHAEIIHTFYPAKAAQHRIPA